MFNNVSNMTTDEFSIESVLERVVERDPDQPNFHQAVHEIMSDIIPFIQRSGNEHYKGVINRIIEPDRIIQFKVPWENDQRVYCVNRGFRVQFNNALGPYKGGLRFHPNVKLDTMKFLAFEQIFKNSLTGLPLGGGKGGSDFNPKGKSDAEIMRFCQSFMSELVKYISADMDVPAGDIGVGEREVGYMFGQYKRLTSQYHGSMTGKGLAYGGSKVRAQATGYGVLYFVREMLAMNSESLEGKTLVISGTGNVAQASCEKALEMGARVIAMSDSDGYVYDPEGIDERKIQWIREHKNERRGRICDYAAEFGADFGEGTPWHIPCDIALPCATENEIGEEEALTLIANGVSCVAEGANMPCTDAAVRQFRHHNIAFAPGKASNAGGVAVSGLEMAQNSQRLSWSFKDVDDNLIRIMKRIHRKCLKYGQDGDYVNYVRGANIAGFTRVADAMLAQGNV